MKSIIIQNNSTTQWFVIILFNIVLFNLAHILVKSYTFTLHVTFILASFHLTADTQNTPNGLWKQRLLNAFLHSSYQSLMLFKTAQSLITSCSSHIHVYCAYLLKAPSGDMYQVDQIITCILILTKQCGERKRESKH